ncbi:MAG TPA: aspartate dehydrogenase [Bosea sp. (in: a-proteobacteria)]|uniref:aspartate dehydrogenase n=1 Tax=Bosea sp. (in: a-proteobacteria) TaxID=1871050 RepID=UPI002E14113B|nr:aspartate dehydrogenase [Bosea sp. (in: a-proteobacteria)]
MSARRVVLIGYGAIASDIAAALLEAEAPGYALGVLLRPGSPSRARVPAGIEALSGLEELEAFAPDLVIEAAGHEAVRDSVPGCLGLGLPVLISSIGALHDEAFFAGLLAKARRGGGRLLLASGALGGLDYVRAVRHAKQLELRYVSRKPPAAWSAELRALGHDPASLPEPVTLFSGTAREAAALYPQNLNVAAALALAGPGFEATGVDVVCDPAASGNMHVVTAKSEFGTMSLEIANRPSPSNPKSSWIVGQALLAAIEQHFSPVAML